MQTWPKKMPISYFCTNFVGPTCPQNIFDPKFLLNVTAIRIQKRGLKWSNSIAREVGNFLQYAYMRPHLQISEEFCEHGHIGAVGQA